MSILDTLTKSLVQVYSDRLSEQEQFELIKCLEIIADDQKYNKFKNLFPDSGEFSRDKYPKQLSFFRAGSKWKERAFIAGNRVGKSEAGCFETVCHATGLYPEWWEGKRYTRPILIWVGGDTATTVRDIIQKKLVGEVNDIGSGMIPKDMLLIDECKTRRNVPEAYEILRVRHITGGTSTIVLKTYEQGRITWQGAEVDFIWVDEECPDDVYGEALIRTMTTKGSVITTFTPLQGITPLVLSFLDNAQDTESANKVWVEVCAWNDVPHLSEEEKASMLARCSPALREARSKGVPTVGSGLIYPVDQDKVVIDDFKIPHFWKRSYALDVGWNATAATFAAYDGDNDILYIHSEHKQAEAEPIIHAKAIKSRGEWLKGVIDPAARGRSQIDGESLYNLYRKEGLKLYPAHNAVEAGINEVWQRLSTGRLKIFKSCTQTIREMSIYHRDEKGKIVKSNDHLMDCLKYTCLSLSTAYAIWSYPMDTNRSPNKVVDISDRFKACV